MHRSRTISNVTTSVHTYHGDAQPDQSLLTAALVDDGEEKDGQGRYAYDLAKHNGDPAFLPRS